MVTAPARWKKASFSAQQANCVEVANTLSALRDSKDRKGAALLIDVPALVTAIKAGKFEEALAATDRES